jgi:hypothetical protein
MRRMSPGVGGAASPPLLGTRSQAALPPPPYQVQNCVMESMHARARVRFHSPRHGTALMIERARKELESRKARRRPGAG